jgi:hypothetical protein
MLLVSGTYSRTVPPSDAWIAIDITPWPWLIMLEAFYAIVPDEWQLRRGFKP